MAAGIIDHESGSRDMRRLNGLWKYMPHTATLAMVAAASMAGVPLFNGFLSKEMFFTEALELRQAGTLWWIVPPPRRWPVCSPWRILCVLSMMFFQR